MLGSGWQSVGGGRQGRARVRQFNHHDMARSIAVLVSGILALIHKVLASSGRQKAKNPREEELLKIYQCKS